ASRPADQAVRAALDDALARPGGSRETLEKLEAALAAGTGTAWREFVQYFHGVWSARRAALDALLGANARIADWRALAGVDADAAPTLGDRRGAAGGGAGARGGGRPAAETGGGPGGS